MRSSLVPMLLGALLALFPPRPAQAAEAVSFEPSEQRYARATGWSWAGSATGVPMLMGEVVAAGGRGRLGEAARMQRSFWFLPGALGLSMGAGGSLSARRGLVGAGADEVTALPGISAWALTGGYLATGIGSWARPELGELRVLNPVLLAAAHGMVVWQRAENLGAWRTLKGDDWRADYGVGQGAARAGQTMGLIGLGGAALGAGMVLGGQTADQPKHQAGWALLGGIVVVGSAPFLYFGGSSLLLGTTHEHLSLRRGGVDSSFITGSLAWTGMTGGTGLIVAAILFDEPRPKLQAPLAITGGAMLVSGLVLAQVQHRQNARAAEAAPMPVRIQLRF